MARQRFNVNSVFAHEFALRLPLYPSRTDCKIVLLGCQPQNFYLANISEVSDLTYFPPKLTYREGILQVNCRSTAGLNVLALKLTRFQHVLRFASDLNFEGCLPI